MAGAVFPPCCLTCGGGNEDGGDLLQKVPRVHCCTKCSGPLLTHASAKDSWTLMGKSGSASVGVAAPLSSILVHKVLSVPPGLCFPVLCKFWQFSGGVNGDLLQEGSCRTQVCCTQSPAPAAGHCWPTCTSIGDTQTLRHSGLAQCLWRLLVRTRFCWVLRVSLAGVRFDSKCSFAPPTVLLGLLLCLWGKFFWWDPTLSCQWLLSSEL